MPPAPSASRSRSWRIAAIFTALAPVAALAGWRIEPLLPARGRHACFAGSFDPPVPLTLGRPGEAGKPTAGVVGLTLRFGFDAAEKPFRSGGRGYDWRYDFQFAATLDDHRTVRAGGACDWIDHPVSRILPVLDCYIDCDGGGVSFTRAFARSAVDVNFGARDWLRFSQGCGMGGAVLSGGGQARSFRLETAAPETCDKPGR